MIVFLFILFVSLLIKLQCVVADSLVVNSVFQLLQEVIPPVIEYYSPDLAPDILERSNAVTQPVFPDCQEI